MKLLYKSLKISLFVLLFTGCNQIGFFYDYADWYIMYKIDSYFDINDAQEDFLDPKIDQLHAWHRREEIPRVITFLTQVKIEVQNGFSEKNLPWIESEYKQMRDRVNQKIADDIATFLATLSNDQIDYFENKLEEDNKRHEDRRSNRTKRTDEEWRERRQERIIERLEDWYGDLTDHQKKTVLANVVLVRQDQTDHDEERREVQKRIIKLMRAKKTTNEIKEYISAWFMDPSIFSSTNYEEEVEKRKVTWMDYWIKLNEILSQKQKQHALNKLQDYIDMLEDIHDDEQDYAATPESSNVKLDYSLN
jgi:hypothetical protein